MVSSCFNDDLSFLNTLFPVSPAMLNPSDLQLGTADACSRSYRPLSFVDRSDQGTPRPSSGVFPPPNCESDSSMVLLPPSRTGIPGRGTPVVVQCHASMGTADGHASDYARRARRRVRSCDLLGGRRGALNGRRRPPSDPVCPLTKRPSAYLCISVVLPSDDETQAPST